VTQASPTTGVLTLSCPDVAGIVHAVSGFLLEQGCTIVESQQYEDPDTNTFFMRVKFAGVGGDALDFPALEASFAVVADTFGMGWKLVDADKGTRTVIMLSKYAH